VQGVGFRPFVWQLAHRFGLSGDVANDAEGVVIRIATSSPEAFLTAPLATGFPDAATCARATTGTDHFQPQALSS
jgi:hydrogenase maturation protein HypF